MKISNKYEQTLNSLLSFILNNNIVRTMLRKKIMKENMQNTMKYQAYFVSKSKHFNNLPYFSGNNKVVKKISEN